MDLRDLAFLILIPLLLIGVIFYIGDTPSISKGMVSITGLVPLEKRYVSEEDIKLKNDNILGIYSIKPGFQAKIDYDLGDYGKIKDLFKSILKCVDDKDSTNENTKDVKIESCMVDAESKDPSFNWVLGCDKGSEFIFYDFVEFYQNCIESDDTNCLCRKTLELSVEKINEYGLASNSYELNLNKGKSSKKIDIKMPESHLNHIIDLKESRSTWYPNHYVLGYGTKEFLRLTMIFKNQLSGETYSFDETKDVKIYKNKADGINYINFVGYDEDGNLIYPSREIIKTEGTEGIHDCKLKTKSAYRFCVTKIYSNKPVTIKFATYILDSQ